MTNPPDISVVIPFYNAEPTVGACVESLLHQAGVPASYEIVLVDNNSTDASADVVRSFDDERVRLLSEPTQGAYAARNHGVRAARGDTLAFTDPDCIAEDRWLERIVEPLTRPEVGVVMGRVLPGRATFLLDLWSRFEANKEGWLLGQPDASMYFGRTNNMAIRRPLLEEQGLFTLVLRGGDTRFVREAAARHGPDVLAYEPRARVTHLEIASIFDHLRKVRIYGGTTGRGDEAIGVPTSQERWRLVRTTGRERGRPVRDTAALGTILAMESVAWKLGKLGW